jgi:hypothetical protein
VIAASALGPVRLLTQGRGGPKVNWLQLWENDALIFDGKNITLPVTSDTGSHFTFLPLRPVVPHLTFYVFW